MTEPLAEPEPARRKLALLIGKYAVVGVIGTLIHIGTTVVLVEALLTPPVTASVLGFILAVLVSFRLNSHWTFSVTDRPVQRLARYIIISLLGLSINALIMYSVVNLLELNYLLGLALVVLVIPPLNFSLNFLWSFRAQRGEPESSP